MIHTFPTPEAAALAGFPPGVARVLASRTGAAAAYVLLDTNAAGQLRPYPYGVSCERAEGGWVEGSSSNAGGWSQTGPDDERGSLVLWGEAPAGADRARVRYSGEVFEEPVRDGWLLVAWWGVPCPKQEDWPRIEEWRVGGAWVACADARGRGAR